MSECLNLSLENHVATVTLNRPKVHNALNEVLIQHLLDTLSSLNQNPEVHVVVIKGEGKHFCAGADLGWMKGMGRASARDNQKDALKLADLFLKLDELSKPVIVLVQGAAYGGGLGIMACADVVVASETAHFCFSEVKFNLIPAVISPYVIRAIGERQARRYFLTGEKFGVEAAFRMNLVHHIDNQDNLNAAAEPFVEAWLSYRPEVLGDLKQWICHLRQGAVSVRETSKKMAEYRASTAVQERLAKFG